MRCLSRGAILLLIFLFSPWFIRGANSLGLVINEIAWMGTQVSYNDEWVELYNNTDSEINLSGWRLVAEDGAPEISLAGVISANGFYLLERTNDETIPGTPADQLYTGALGNKGENLVLYDNAGNLIDSVNCSSGWFVGDNSSKQTMERRNPQSSGSESANWQTSQNSGGTPRGNNTMSLAPQPQPQPELPTQEEKVTEAGTPSTKIVYPGSIVINEILPSPTGPDETEEWIEIFNQNNFEANLSDWKIADTVGGVMTYTFPQGIKISPQGFFVLPRPTTKITLNNDGDGVSLIQPDGEIVETINYPKALQGQSYNRTGEKWSWGTTLTPGKINQPGISEVKKEVLGEAEASLLSPEISLERGKESLSTMGKTPKFSKSSFIFLIASILAIFSGGIILILKKKIKYQT